jgi:ferric-dicitrate binding protein FerR (iron transport regulator)
MSRAGSQNCSAHAEEAARLARRATSGEEREAYERIAAVWAELAASDKASHDARVEHQSPEI